jgi:hypothetical protein
MTVERKIMEVLRGKPAECQFDLPNRTWTILTSNPGLLDVKPAVSQSYYMDHADNCIQILSSNVSSPLLRQMWSLYLLEINRQVCCKDAVLENLHHLGVILRREAREDVVALKMNQLSLQSLQTQLLKGGTSLVYSVHLNICSNRQGRYWDRMKVTFTGMEMENNLNFLFVLLVIKS